MSEFRFYSVMCYRAHDKFLHIENNLKYSSHQWEITYLTSPGMSRRKILLLLEAINTYSHSRLKNPALCQFLFIFVNGIFCSLQEMFCGFDDPLCIMFRYMGSHSIITDIPEFEQPIQIFAALLINVPGFDNMLMER